MKTKLRSLEDQHTKAQLSNEKDQALFQQKSQFIETENKKLTSRVDELYQENRNLSKRLQDCESELRQSDI